MLYCPAQVLLSVFAFLTYNSPEQMVVVVLLLLLMMMMMTIIIMISKMIMHVQLSLYFQFYLLCLLSNRCDENGFVYSADACNVARVSCNITGNTCIFCNITRNTLHASASAVRVFLRIRRIHKADRNGAEQRVFLGRLLVLVALKRAGFS